MNCRLLYSDEHYVAVEKPTGMSVHRTGLDASNEPVALQSVRDHLGIRVYPVHRLDKPTSGALVFGKSAEAAAALAELFASRAVEKRYQALVRGWMVDHGLIDYPLTRTRDSPRPGPPQEARTRFRSEHRFEAPHPVSRYETARSSLVTLKPETGRTHQLRRHMKHLFHPIVGDRKYGDDAHNRLYASVYRTQRLMLACVHIGFVHPFGGPDVVVDCAPDAEFRALVDALAQWEFRSC